MIRRFATTAVLGAAAAATLMTAASTGGQLALASMSTPLDVTSYSAPPPPPPKKCAANFTSGIVGGQSKCLAAGQQCQQAHVADYTHYGFNCAKVGNGYQLKSTKAAPAKAAPPKPAAAKPAPAKPAPAKPAPAHH